VSDRERRVFVAETPRPGDRVTLDADEAHHATRVLRLKAGDAVAAFDGAGGEWDATIAEASPRGAVVEIGRRRDVTVEPPIRVILHQAVVRPDKLEWVLQKGTEVGIAGFRLIETERAEAPLPSPSRLARCRRIVMEACKQSGRVRLPELSTGSPEPPGPGRTAIVLAPVPAARPLGELLAGAASSEVWLAVGPEGGFTDREVAGFAGSGWSLATLGPRVLRTETAGCVAAAIVLSAWGDLGRAV
jgi:16S rRNA (uracil1498-N3)-methyltransferase